MREILLASPRLFADETTMPVLDPGRGRTKKGYAWAIARDDRPWGGTDPPAVVFRYAPGRGAEPAKALLAGYRGILQCDGYGAYQTLAAASEGITLAFCWSHLRRRFIELAKGKTAPIAGEAPQRIAVLYTVEAEARGKPPDIRRAVRRERSRPLVEDLFAWLSAQLARFPGSSPTAEAIRYALNHREGLVRFLEDGRIELDTNTVERAIRPICVSRKDALFASGDDGGALWAAVASLVETCKPNGVDPQRYLAGAVNPESPVLRLKAEGEVVEALLVHAEDLGDAGDGVDEAHRGHCQAACARAAPLRFQFHGRSSSRRDAGWSAMRASKSASQARGAASFSFAVTMRE